ncbi:transposase [Bacillus sp. V3-13]|uniref:RNA-guided endonuclease InsQ/TnpB family protein n=1 Tax=Bacillus sp. V3-13 TaxID=2053728 RepID=UPI000C77A3D0|nr:RNA-guided endonuclease TnpB family protein [Bacillus sp. V3-13]PLR77539.1 transposase [Bacillus sp. V3-13]
MIRTFKFRIEPTEKQRQKIGETLMYCRRLYNACLEERIAAYKKYGVSLTFYSQKKELPELKQECPEYKSVHSQVLQNVVERLDNAYQSFFQRLEKGENAGFPRFKGANRYRSFTYPQSGFSLEGKYINLSKIGKVRIKLHRQVKGNIKTCTVIEKNGKYFVSLSCEMNKQANLSTNKKVGVDLGVRHLAVTSDGQFFDSPKYLLKSERQLKRLQRMVFKRKKGSQRRKKAVALLAKKHEYIANQRRNNAHQVSRILVNQYDLIAFENLNITNMVKNHRLAKRISDAGWNQLITFTTYKAESAGKCVVLVDPRNTSQQCSNCNEMVKKTLADRVHHCPSCGLECDRDVNASINILHRAIEAVS